MSFPFLDFESSFFTNEELLFLAGASGGGVEHTIINNPATFTTDLSKPLRRLVIPFTPVQSGSGDPSPSNVRPITGWTGLNINRTGINLCPGGWVDGGIVDGAESPDNRFQRTGLFPVVGSKKYYIVSNDTYRRVFWYAKDGTFISSNTTSAQEKTAPANAFFARCVIAKETTPNPAETYSFNFPSSETEYVPYSGATIPVAFPATKNLLDFNAQSRNGLTVTKTGGKAVITGTATGEAFPMNFIAVVLPAGTYTWSVSGLKSGMTMEYAIGGSWAGSVSTTSTFTLSAESRITGYVKANEGTETNTTVSVQLESGSSSTSFEPYGTVYGGTLDALTGVLTVTHKMWTKNTNEMNRGSDTYPGWNQCGIKEFVGGNKDGAYSVIMNCGKVVGIVTEGSADNVYLAYSRYGLTEAEWKALALDVQIACELATPQTVQLDPVTLSTLIGENVVWTDTNGDNTIVYLKKT